MPARALSELRQELLGQALGCSEDRILLRWAGCLPSLSSRLPTGPVPGKQHLFSALKASPWRCLLEQFHDQYCLKFGEAWSNLAALAFHVKCLIIFKNGVIAYFFVVICCHHLIILYIFLVLSVRPWRYIISKSWSSLDLLDLRGSFVLTSAYCSGFCPWIRMKQFTCLRSYMGHV